jgi:hypothetical protein
MFHSPKELHFRGYLLPYGVDTIVPSGMKILIQATIVYVTYGVQNTMCML